MAWKIKRNVIEDLLDAARNTYPDEFFALLGGKKEGKEIDEFVVVPAVFGKEHTLVRTDLVPFDRKILGSVHSHPSPYNSPSSADLANFGRFGEIHFIIAYPFGLNTTRAFNVKGIEQEFEVVE